MKLTQLAGRDMTATNRMVAAAEILAERFGLDAEMDRVRTQKGDPAVRQMLQREAVADLLEQLVKQTEPMPVIEPKAKSTGRGKSK